MSLRRKNDTILAYLRHTHVLHMAIKELRKNIPSHVLHEEEKVKKFISQDGGLVKDQQITQDSEHRLTLRIPKWLVDKVDKHRKSRVGKNITQCLDIGTVRKGYARIKLKMCRATFMSGFIYTSRKFSYITSRYITKPN